MARLAIPAPTAASTATSGWSSNAKEHKLACFKVGYFYSEVAKDVVGRKIISGDTVRGLDGRPDLSLAELDATDRIIAVAGIHPYVKLLDMGADVIIGGRSSDSAIFAAPAIRQGYPQLTEACGWDEPPRYLIRDRDGAYGAAFIRRVRWPAAPCCTTRQRRGSTFLTDRNTKTNSALGSYMKRQSPTR